MGSLRSPLPYLSYPWEYFPRYKMNELKGIPAVNMTSRYPLER